MSVLVPVLASLGWMLILAFPLLVVERFVRLNPRWLYILIMATAILAVVVSGVVLGVTLYAHS